MKDMTTLATNAHITQLARSFSPIYICEIELSSPLPDIVAVHEQTGQLYQRAHCLIRLHTQPLGLFELVLGGPEAKAENYAPCLWQELGEQINEHLRADGLPTVTGLDTAGLPAWQTPTCLREREAFLQRAPFASIVLSTRDRPDLLARCLPALLTQQYPAYEVIIVDNASTTSATADLIQRRYADEPRIRYVREDRPGLSAARNRGVLAAQGEIIAFTDDDVMVDTYWLAGLAQGFEVAEQVACVTNLILPLKLDNAIQLWFEEFGGFNKGFKRRIFDRKSGNKDAPLYPFTAGTFGTGAGMAFTAAFLSHEKGFDCALGAGSLAGGGEDLAAFLRVIQCGHCLVYEPSSLAYHEHRSDYKSLQKQLYYYGVGLTAYLTKIVIDHPFLLFRIMLRIPLGLVYILSARSAKNQRKSADFPRELANIEKKGMLRGPLLYLKGRFMPSPSITSGRY